jgi:hypothetical protein
VSIYWRWFSQSARQTDSCLCLARFVSTYNESLHVTSLGVKDTSMDSRCRILSSFLVGSDSASLDRSSLEEVEALFNHIKFHESTMTLFRILNGVQFNTVKTVPVESSTTSEVEKTVSECEFCYDSNRVRICC